ncbi:ABC transporter ATP-binding protein [Paenibacillus aestuarii]|uniref:ABC transporter ATP-binding protein n=1 Tax=Paenibacillus aestuarii TaxID=516965 RepID=A0ABW0K0D8_9BACL|nr:ABC transporter ATP-binding protein [Paenibacillus aestuarii]
MDSTTINVKNVSKVYKIYNKPQDRLKQTLFRGRKQYYHEFSALKDISFTIHRGEFVGIIGQNGSGKSTLLQLIAGTLTPSEGEIKVNGRISALLELGSGFNPEFTGRENVFLNGAILGISRSEMEKRYEDIVNFADIGDYIDQPVKTYSSGMYVRLAFAVAISVDPDILIVDEALAVGDGRFQLKCFERIKAMKEAGTTILLVSHDLQSIRQFCDVCYLFDKGKLLEFGNPNEVVNHYTKVLFSKEDKPLVEVKSQEAPSESFKGANNNKLEKAVQEYRYGSQEGIIENIEILNDNGEPVTSIDTCDQVIIKMKVKAKKNISKPIYALTIKSIKGLEVYGTNSYFQNYPFEPLKEGEVLEVQFIQRVSLMPGNYFLSFGFVELVDGEIVPLDRRYDFFELKVLSKEKDRSFGIANLETNILIKSPVTEVK